MKYFPNTFCLYNQTSIMATVLVKSVVLPFLFTIAIALFCYYSFGFVPSNSYAAKGSGMDHVIVNTSPLTKTQLDVSHIIFSSQKPSYTHYNVSNNSNNNTSTTGTNTFNTELGTESKNNNNWITINRDIYGTRYSNQTIINKENVANLKIKWRLINDVEIQDPPIILGNKGYVQDYSGSIMAFDADTGQVKWKIKAGNGPTMG